MSIMSITATPGLAWMDRKVQQPHAARVSDVTVVGNNQRKMTLITFWKNEKPVHNRIEVSARRMTNDSGSLIVPEQIL